MGEFCEHPGFLRKTFVTDLRVENFERNGLSSLSISRTKDGAHPTRAGLLLDLEPLGDDVTVFHVVSVHQREGVARFECAVGHEARYHFHMPILQRETHATVDQIESEWVTLDVDGRAVKVPRGMFPDEVREGDGYLIAIRSAPEIANNLAENVKNRLDALTRSNKK